jgi:hypothetical protein
MIRLQFGEGTFEFVDARPVRLSCQHLGHVVPVCHRLQVVRVHAHRLSADVVSGLASERRSMLRFEAEPMDGLELLTYRHARVTVPALALPDPAAVHVDGAGANGGENARVVADL